MSGFKQGVSDITRAAISGVGEAYEAVLTGRHLHPTHLTGEMIQSSGPAEDIPQSYEAALREHQAMADADQRAGKLALSADAEQSIEAPMPSPSQSEPDIGA